MSWDANGCKKLMYRPGAFRGVACGKKVTGKHGFCGIHSPEAVAKREALSRARYANEMARTEKRIAEAKERERKLAVFPELLAALRPFADMAPLLSDNESDAQMIVGWSGMRGTGRLDHGDFRAAVAAIAKAEGKP